MTRRPLRLLDERLAKRAPQLRRLKFVYDPINTHSSTTSPPRPASPQEAEVDRLLGELAREFDLTAILSGDRVATKRLADEFAKRFVREASREQIEPAILGGRVDVLLPWIYRGLRTFTDQIRLAMRSKT